MPQQANIVINDGAATPVAHTFAPDGQTGLESSFAERASGIALGFNKIKLNMSQSGRNQPLNKIRTRFSLPKLETISGSSSAGLTPAPRLAYSSSIDCTFIFHERATAQERKDARILFANYLLSTLYTDVNDNLSPVW